MPGPLIVAKVIETTVKSSEKIAEVSKIAVKEAVEDNIILQIDLETIETQSLESIIQRNLEMANTTEVPLQEVGLSDAEKAEMKAETGWSDEIFEHIKTKEEYEIYKQADLHEAEINGRKCLIKDIDLNYIDSKTITDSHPNGLTNRELMEKGRSPYDATTGERLELHHMGQDYDSPLAELSENSEHGDGNDTILHDKSAESFRNDPEKNRLYNNVQRPEHWKTRVEVG